MLACFPLSLCLPPLLPCARRVAQRESWGHRRNRNERTVHRPSNTWHLGRIRARSSPPATICAWLPGCTSFTSALHRLLNRRRVVISRRGPLTKKEKKKRKTKKKRGEFPTPLSSPLCLVRSWVSHPPDCQTANTEKSLNLFFLQCDGGYSYVAW